MEFLVYNGKPILGANIYGASTNFAIFSKHATKAIIQIFAKKNDINPIFEYELSEIKNKTGDIWHVMIYGVGHGSYYGWRLDGPYDLMQGDRFNINKLLIDPYSKALAGDLDLNNSSVYGYDTYCKQDSISKLDSAIATYKSVVIDDIIYDWEGDTPLHIPMEDTIIYELHVRLFTQSPTSEVMCKGTFRGILEKLDHLKELGVTTLELLPIYEFNMNSNSNKNPITGEKLKDIWGYNPNSFFAVSKYYTETINDGDEVFYFKDFIKAAHKVGLEVILDVVYNHTGEGSEKGPTISLRGIDNRIYYMLKEEDKRYYINYSGTGNTLNCNHLVVKKMILDSLHYWVTEMHVDGFRFDLASILGRDSKGQWIGQYSLLKDIVEDPILAKCKLIAESWDAAGGYHVGEMPAGFAEWNGAYRDIVRKFIKGDLGTISNLATCITGSSDIFNKCGKSPLDSINFITAHDGFTMWDLVTYNNKHNVANGEDNKDGMNNNESYNYGVEGETDNIEITLMRKKQVKNFITLLMISQGTPMIVMGDEFCRTQMGNNNPYCQDNEITWVDWTRKENFKDIYRYFCKIIHFRKAHPALRRKQFLGKCKKTSITWHGINVDCPDWSYHSRTIAFMLHNNETPELADDANIYVAINGYEKPLAFQLPMADGLNWHLVVDTGQETPNDFLEEPVAIKNGEYVVEPFSIVICIGNL